VKLEVDGRHNMIKIVPKEDSNGKKQGQVLSAKKVSSSYL
jgi:hypothetical protein